MDLIFNELSTSEAHSIDAAKKMMEEMIHICRLLRGQTEGHNAGIRFPKPLSDMVIAENNYTIKNFATDSTVKKNIRDIIFGIYRFPEVIDTEDDDIELEYLNNNYTCNGKSCSGLAIARLLQYPAVSFNSSVEWQSNCIQISITNTRTDKSWHENVCNLFSKACLGSIFVQEQLAAFLLPPKLVPSEIKWSQKEIHLSQHHGTDELKLFSKSLCKNQYVNSVINSLAMNSEKNNFIEQVHPDGILYLRLHWTEQGLGIAVSTTARNYREAQAIAQILEDKFDR